MDQVGRLGDQGVAEDFLDPDVMVRVQIVSGNLHANTSRAKVERPGEPFERVDRIFGLAASPGPELIDQCIVLEFVAFPLAGEDGDGPVRGGDQEALKLLITLRVRPGQPVDRHRMEDQQPIQPGLRRSPLASGLGGAQNSSAEKSRFDMVAHSRAR